MSIYVRVKYKLNVPLRSDWESHLNWEGRLTDPHMGSIWTVLCELVMRDFHPEVF